MKCSSEWPVNSQVTLDEVMSLRNIGSIASILMRGHVRNRLFHGRIESLYFEAQWNLATSWGCNTCGFNVSKSLIWWLATSKHTQKFSTLGRWKTWIFILDQIQGLKTKSEVKKKRELYAVLIGNPQKSLYTSRICGENLRFMSLWGQFIQQKHKASAHAYDSPSSNKHTFNSNTKETGEGWKGAWFHQGWQKMETSNKTCIPTWE